MHLERGPSGSTFVFILESEMSVVPHAFERMRSDGIPFVLPIYLRDVFGERQICADVTGLCPITDVLSGTVVYDDVLLHHLIDFFSTPVLMEDYFLSSDYLLTDPRFIFWDTRTKAIYWLAVPIESARGTLFSINENLSARMQKIISCPFFNDFFREKNTNDWLAFLDVSDEDNYLSATERLFTLVEAKSTLPSQSEDPQTPRLRKRLSVIAGFSFSLLLVLLATNMFSFSLRKYLPLAAFLVGATLLFLLLLATRKKRTTIEATREHEVDEQMKDAAGNVLTRINDIAAYPEAFIERVDDKLESSTRKQLSQKYPLLLQDCLIGRDSILCDIFVDDPSVSDRHARILKRSGTYFLMDAGSFKGTILGDRKIYSYEENPLSDQDIFSIGDIRFVFHTYAKKGGI